MDKTDLLGTIGSLRWYSANLIAEYLYKNSSYYYYYEYISSSVIIVIVIIVIIIELFYTRTTLDDVQGITEI